MRAALAGVLAGLPAWRGVTSAGLEPSEADAQLSILAESFVRGVFLPRQDQERRAGGVFSWNTGVDYRAGLRNSGRRDGWTLDRRAGLDLDRDLAALNAAPRVRVAREAVRYMAAHYEPTAAPQVPLLSYHTVGDGMTSPVMQSGYARAVMPDEASIQFRAVWVNAWGTWQFQAEHIAGTRCARASSALRALGGHARGAEGACRSTCRRRSTLYRFLAASIDTALLP